MADKDYAPLSTACVRALNDRLYEKRKAAALEIEKMVKDFVSVGNTSQIKKLLKVLGAEFAISQNPHMRKGGLIGLAAMAIGLGRETGGYTEELITPILTCLSDADSRVRYYACESLYNVVKVSREAVLPLFNEIFSSISCVVADPDQNVKNGSELLDRLLKDIVTESKSPSCRCCGRGCTAGTGSCASSWCRGSRCWTVSRTPARCASSRSSWTPSSSSSPTPARRYPPCVTTCWGSSWATS